MLVKLGEGMVNPDEVVYAKPHGDGLSIEVMFRSNSKVFNNGKTVLIESDNDPEKDIEAFLKCLSS